MLKIEAILWSKTWKNLYLNDFNNKSFCEMYVSPRLTEIETIKTKMWNDLFSGYIWNKNSEPG